MKEIILKYNNNLPRYTSYPTSPHFKNVKESDFSYHKWLDSIKEEEEISLYFHVPFCQEICSFCGCHTKGTNKYEPVAKYTKYLIKEIELVAKNIKYNNKVKHIHFGGGTPTILSVEDMDELMKAIYKNFNIDSKAEIAIEVDPREISEDKIKLFSLHGFNRVSIGVQDFHPKIQKIINRIQPTELTASVVEMFKKHGIDNISFDLMYGLPMQDIDIVLANIDIAMNIKPNRISLFGYAHVPWMKKHQTLIVEEWLPDASLRYDMFVELSKKLVDEYGFVQIGLDHFARSDDDMAIAFSEKRLNRNFQGYTTDKAENLIGFGVSSIGYTKYGYVQNSVNKHEYFDAIDNNQFPNYRYYEVTLDDVIRKEIINNLMCYMEVDLNIIQTKYQLGKSFFDYELKKMQNFEKDFLINMQEGYIKVSQNSRIAVRIVASVFDEYFERSERRHSTAI